MARELLTAKGLEAALKRAQADAAARQTRVKIRDGDNLIMIVRPNGGASWVLQYRAAGKRLPLTLGAWPDVSLKLARELADRARARLAAGDDPRPPVPAKAASTDTVRALFVDWLARQRISDVYRGNIEAAIGKDVLPAIGAKAPRAVTRQDVLGILRQLEARGALEMLRRVRMWLHQLFEFALDAERVDGNPVPTGHLKSFMSHQAGHFPAITDPAEVPALLLAIDGYPRPIVRAALQLSALVWQRPSEIRLGSWGEFDLGAAKWVIPAARMKGKREHWVPLSRQAVALLRQHQGVVGTVGPLFPGRSYGDAISEATVNGALEALGYKGRHTPHGFRAMARTILEERLGFPAAPLERQLAHEEESKVARAYNRAQHWDARVQVMQAWADWLDAQRLAGQATPRPRAQASPTRRRA